MKYKVGDKVRINPSCKANEQYGGITLFDHMMFDGVKTISNIEHGVSIRLHGIGYHYRAEMFVLADEEPAPEPKKPNGKFNIGDRVRCTGNYDNAVIIDKLGKIVGEKVDNSYPVEFDEPVRFKSGSICGHDCDGKAKDEHGWWVKAELLTLEVVLFEDPVEVIDVVIPTKPIVVIPVISDSFTKSWMESFVKRIGGEPVNG